MPITIGTNIASLRTQRELGSSTEALSRVYERLSSGQRINRASDDAAGLAIASKLNASSRVLTQAIRNVNDGISVLSVAEGAVQQLNGVLQRQRELATQAANGTYGSSQRQALQNESNQLTSEFNRIIASTSFNGMTLLDGSSRQFRIQVGDTGSVDSQIGFDLSALSDVSTNTTGGTGSITTANSGTAEVTQFNFNNSIALEYFTFSVGNAASYSAGDYLAFSVMSGGDEFKFVAWFRKDGLGSAPVGPPVAGYTAFAVDITSADTADTVGGKLATAIDVNVGVNVGTYLGGGIFEVDSIDYGNVSDPFGAVLRSSTHTDGAVVNTGDYIRFSTTTGNYYVWFQKIGDVGGDPSIPGATGFMVEFDPVDNGYFLAGDAENAINSGVSGLSASTDGTGYILTLSNSINGTVLTTPSVNALGSNIAVTVTQNGTSTSIDPTSDTISISAHGYSTGQQVNLSTSGSLPGGLSTGSYYAIKVDNNTIKLATSAANASGGIAVNLSSYGAGMMTLTPPGAVTTTTYNPYITNLDLTSQSAARGSLDTLVTQTQKVTNTLGAIGASQSRLNVAAQTIAVTRENSMAAAARIMDADIAANSAELVRRQILQQASSAILAQANQQPSLALQLLKG